LNPLFFPAEARLRSSRQTGRFRSDELPSSLPPHLSSSNDGVDLKSPARRPKASDLTQPYGKGSLFKVDHEKSTGHLEHSRGTSASDRGFLEFHPPHADINLLNQVSRFRLDLSKQSASLFLFFQKIIRNIKSC
jgi:hypothetical protein